MSRESADFSWCHFHQAREDLQMAFWENDSGADDYDSDAMQIPRSLLFEPHQVKDSLYLLLNAAQHGGLTSTQNFYHFEVHLADGTVFKHDYLHVATRLQLWRLESGHDVCHAISAMNAEGTYLKRPLRENWLLNHRAGDELIEGYVYSETGVMPFITRTRAEAIALAQSEAVLPERLYLGLEAQPDDITVQLTELIQVCDFAITNGYLLDVQHSY